MVSFSTSDRAISPVLAVLMMITVAIASSLVVYAWIMGYIDLSTERSGEAIMIQNVFNDGTDLKIYVQNVGEDVVQLEEDICLYVNGIPVPCSIYGVTVSDGTATLSQGETATLRYSGGAASQGEKVNVKVVTLRGTSAEEYAYPAGSAGTPHVSVMWTQTYGGEEAERACSVVETSDGGYAIAGSTGFGTSYIRFWLVKTDVFGNMEWNRTYDGGIASSLVATSDGGYAIVGGGHLVKTDEFGDREWCKVFGGTLTSLVETSDGGYAIAGYTESFDYCLIKTDEIGNMEWSQSYDGAEWDLAYSLVATSDGGYAIAGWTTISVGDDDNDFWLVKTDEYGEMEWNRTYGGEAGSDQAYSLVENSDGGYAIAGGNLLVKTNASGNMEWNRTYGGGIASSLVATSDGGYALAGCTKYFGGDSWLIKTDEFGNMEWDKVYGRTESAEANSLVATSDGGYAIAGTTGPLFKEDFWLVKTDEYGNTR